MADLSSLMQNRLFLQYLSGAGQDISAGRPIGQNVNTITQQAIAAKSQAVTNKKMMQMLADMMSGKLTPGSSIKMSDKGDMTMNLPKSALESLNLGQEGSKMPGGSGTDWTAGNMPGFVNPFR